MITLLAGERQIRLIVAPLYFPGAYDHLADLVAPVVQRYNVYRHEYGRHDAPVTPEPDGV